MALTLLHADTFNRSDRNLNGDTMSDGIGVWTDDGGGNHYAIVTNKATNVGGEKTTHDSVMPSSTTDQRAEAKITTGDTGVIFRWAVGGGGLGTFYLAYLNGGLGITLYYYNGGFTSIGSGGSMSSGDTLGGEAVGTQITAYANGVSQCTVSDATFSTGQCGLYGGGGGASSFDDFADYVAAAAGGVSRLVNGGLVNAHGLVNGGLVGG